MALGPWDRPPEPLLQGTPTVRATLVTPLPSYCLGPSLGRGNVLRGSGPSFAQVCQWGTVCMLSGNNSIVHSLS